MKTVSPTFDDTTEIARSLRPLDHRTPTLLAWSGGKDSSLALAALRASPDFQVAGLLTTVTEEFERITMHGIRVDLLEKQAATLDLPLTIVRIPPVSSNETYEQRMAVALEQARDAGVSTVAFGDLFLTEVRDYRIRMLSGVGMKAIFPLWDLPTAQLAESFIDDGFRAVLTCIDTTQIPDSFAGREFDRGLLSELPPGADPCGENGEFHTFVFDAPIFKRPIPITQGETVLRDNRFVFCDFS